MKEALKLALEALENAEYGDYDKQELDKAITAIKEALAPTSTQCEVQDELCSSQGPVAWITPDGEGFRIRFSPPTSDVPLGWDALYTAPQASVNEAPKRPWVGLIFAEICEAEVVATEGFNNFSGLKFARAIEAKLKELNT